MRHQLGSSASRHAITVLVAAFIMGVSVGSIRPQDPVTTFPQNYAIALYNGDVTVVRVHYGPHEHIAVHDHSKFPTIYVYLNDSGPVRFDQATLICADKTTYRERCIPNKSWTDRTSQRGESGWDQLRLSAGGA
jgi:hypothetical protein